MNQAFVDFANAITMLEQLLSMLEPFKSELSAQEQKLLAEISAQTADFRDPS